ncbi:hypothetical protein [Beijerinckia sp. L45]|uniref:hypothetical protein n=1 Tax=Beijerinckia sp. L45 TaxID=1641855 RepID=UPI00131BCF57|nr:hypothetical protein [Beijerinckia sp. L45]
MPTSRGLIEIVAEVSGMAPAAVATRFRVIREAGYLPSGGRGRSAVSHGLDAAMRLLVACLASDDARTADKALRDAFLLAPSSFERVPQEGAAPVENEPYRHMLRHGFFADFPTTRAVDPIDVDLTVRRDRPLTSLKKTFFEGLPTARLAPATHFGTVLSCVLEAVRAKTLAPLPDAAAFADGLLPADPEWQLHPRTFASVTLTSGLMAHEWRVVGASIAFGLHGLYRETRKFASADRDVRGPRFPASFRQDRSFDLELMERLIPFFEDEE